MATPEEGLLLEWPDSDKSLIQVDHGSINPESTNTEVMSIYRYMVLLERQKKITKYELSYSEVSRLSGGDTDGFSVKISQGHKFKTMNDASKAASCKTWFGDSISAVEASTMVSKVFRVRFDRVNQCSKLQKPYVMLEHALSLQLGRPVKVGCWMVLVTDCCRFRVFQYYHFFTIQTIVQLSTYQPPWDDFLILPFQVC